MPEVVSTKTNLSAYLCDCVKLIAVGIIWSVTAAIWIVPGSIINAVDLVQCNWRDYQTYKRYAIKCRTDGNEDLAEYYEHLVQKTRRSIPSSPFQGFLAGLVNYAFIIFCAIPLCAYAAIAELVSSKK